MVFVVIVVLIVFGIIVECVKLGLFFIFVVVLMGFIYLI